MIDQRDMPCGDHGDTPTDTAKENDNHDNDHDGGNGGGGDRDDATREKRTLIIEASADDGNPT